jgi:hypothetical protein
VDNLMMMNVGTAARRDSDYFMDSEFVVFRVGQFCLKISRASAN